MIERIVYIKNIRNIISISIHIAAVIIAISTCVIIRFNSIHFSKTSDLDFSIGILTQILAIIVAFLSLGASFYVFSFDASGPIRILQEKCQDIEKQIRQTWFKSFHPRKHKVSSKTFLDLLLRHINTPYLYLSHKRGNVTFNNYIYRPYKDGIAWYPLRNNSGQNIQEDAVIKKLHEIFVCSFEMLSIVEVIRKKNCSFVTKNDGSHGSQVFITDLESLDILHNQTLPEKICYEDSKRVIHLAISAQHYMSEELRNHTENIEWEPQKAVNFFYEYSAYIIWLIYLIKKYNSFRYAFADVRIPGIAKELKEKDLPKLHNKLLSKLHEESMDLRKKAISAYGLFTYLNQLKMSSIPGIGLSLAVILLILITWPILRTCQTESKVLGFALIYSAGIAAFIESSFFLTKIIWHKPQKEMKTFL